MRPERLRSLATWSIAHGLPRALVHSAARRGDLIAGLTVDPDLVADPFAAYDLLRTGPPIASGRTIWATTSHPAATTILRSEDFGVAGGHGELPGPLARLLERVADPWTAGPVDPPSMLATDPPDHGRYRRLVTRAFTAREAQRYEDLIRDRATALLDELERAGGATDLATEYAARLPVAVIADILGIPPAMHDRLLAWGNGAAASLDPALSWRAFRAAEADVRRLHRWFAEHVARLRLEPGEDLLSRLALLEGDDALTDIELHAVGLLVLGAGFETTVNLIGNAVQQLSAHPEQRAVLREDPSLWGNAVEEVLRYDSPVQLTLRSALRDTDVVGQPIRRGTAVLVMLGGANRDPEVFADPHRFDVTRTDAGSHLAFSSGAHYCLGASLARREAEVALRMLYERFPDLTTHGEPTRRGTRVLRGYAHLPVRTGPQVVSAT